MVSVEPQSQPAGVTFSPSADGLGLEILGVDLGRQLDDETFAAVRAAWLQHLVLLFRHQHLTGEQLVAFSRRFGELDVAPPQENVMCSPDGFPEIMIVSNVIENGVPIGNLGYSEAPWHTDMCYTAQPPIASVMYAVEVPSSGGDTSFINMYAAYSALPESLQSSIAGLSLKHDRGYTAVGELRFGERPVSDVTRCPGAIHPIIKVHPNTARKALYLGRRRNAYIMGLPLRESETLLDELWTYALNSGNICRHTWRAGDLVIWDNRCTMHRREAFDPRSRRVMYRTQVRARA